MFRFRRSIFPPIHFLSPPIYFPCSKLKKENDPQSLVAVESTAQAAKEAGSSAAGVALVGVLARALGGLLASPVAGTATADVPYVVVAVAGLQSKLVVEGEVADVTAGADVCCTATAGGDLG